MKTKKLSFMEISCVMSRAEMKKIMAGSGGSGGCTVTFAPGQEATCPPGEKAAGCKSLGSGKYEAYCYVDSSGNCYGVGAATCRQI